MINLLINNEYYFMQKPSRLDRTKFKMQTAEDAAYHISYWKKKTISERLQAAYYLISVAYNFDITSPPRLDRSTFSTRKHAY